MTWEGWAGIWYTLGRMEQDRQCTYNVTLRSVCATIIAAAGKKISITYTESVFVALGIQHEMGMSHIVICGLSGFTVFVHLIT